MSTRTLQNIVNGQHVDSVDGRTSAVVNPATEEAYAQAPVSSAADVDRAMQAAATAFESWRDSTPRDRQKMLLQLADAIEERTDEFVRVESENTGKPLGFTTTEEIPPAVDQVRFFAGAARLLEGRSAGGCRGGGVPRNPRCVRGARADRRRRAGDAVELPADDGDLEDRSGVGGR